MVSCQAILNECNTSFPFHVTYGHNLTSTGFGTMEAKRYVKCDILIKVIDIAGDQSF